MQSTQWSPDSGSSVDVPARGKGQNSSYEMKLLCSTIPEALDYTLMDLFRNDGQHINQGPLFGGITIMFIGNFRQTLPVI